MSRAEGGNENKKEEDCTFFDSENGKCNIYERRLLDCRLFPFDIKLADNKAEYIIGYYPNLCDRDLPDEIEM